MKNKSIVLFTLLSVGGVFAQNDNEELHELIIEENRLQIPIDQTTRNIQIITKEDIQNMPATSINEVLAYITGVDVRQRAPFGTQMDISIDGGSFEQTMVLWNGVKVNDAQTAHHSMNLPIPLSAIERIEVLKGPASRMYGINALTGAINIVTTPKSEEFLMINAYAGSSFKDKDAREGKGIYHGFGTQVSGQIKTGKVNHLAAFQKEQYNGQRYNTAANNIKTFYQGNANLKGNHQIEWLTGYIQNEFGANGFYAAPADENSTEEVKTLISSISGTITLSDNFYIKPRISNRYNEDDYIFIKQKPSVYRNRHFSNALMIELNAVYQTSIGDFGFGYENRSEKLSSSNLGKHNRNNSGFYTEYRSNYKNFIWNIGAYFNQNTDYGFQIYPGIDLAYKINTNWKANASVGSSQRIPSFTDLYYVSKGNVGNPNLKPEAAWQYEFGFDYNDANKKFKINAFRRNIQEFIDWIRPDENTPYSPENFGNQIMDGVHLSWQQTYKPTEESTFSYNLGYQFLSPTTVHKQNKVTSKYVLESLKHQLIVGLNYKYKQFGAHLENRYLKRELNNGYFVMDAKISYSGFTLQANNLLGAEYKEVGAIPLPSRWFQLGYRFYLTKK